MYGKNRKIILPTLTFWAVNFEQKEKKKKKMNSESSKTTSIRSVTTLNSLPYVYDRHTDNVYYIKRWLQNIKPPDIHPRNKCAKFQPNMTIFDVSRLPDLFWLKTCPQAPEISVTELRSYLIK